MSVLRFIYSTESDDFLVYRTENRPPILIVWTDVQNCSPVTFLFGGISSEKKHETRLSTPLFNRLPRNLMLFENLAFEFNSASVTMARQSEFLKFRILKRDTICFKL